MTAYNVLASVFNSTLITFLIYMFFDSLLFKRVKTSVVIIVHFLIALFTSACFIVNNQLSEPIFINYDIVLFASFASSLTFKTKWYNYIVLSFVFDAVYFIAIMFSSAILAIFQIGNNNSEHIAIIDYFFINAATNMIVFIIVMIIKLGKHKLFQHASFKKAVMMILTPISTLGITIALKNIFQATEKPSYGIFVYIALCCFLLMLSNIAVFYYMDSLRENSDNSSAIHAANELIKVQADKYSEMLKSRDIILKLQHDYKNMFLGLVSSINENNIEQVKENLKKQYEELTEQTPVISNGNIIQTLIDMKQETLNSNNIEIELECKNLERNKISPIDLGIIFGNTFDNAVEACLKFYPQEKKIITIHLQVKYNTVVLIMTNPVKRPVKVEYLKSTKDVFGHGYGILSMRNIATKYHGEIDFECSDNKFKVYITMRNLSEDEI